MIAMIAAWSAPAWAQSDVSNAVESLKTSGSIVLFRHALAPGGGDPPGFVLGDCRTQRNLSEEGRDQAKRLGANLLQRSALVGAVWHSQWCRARDTAALAFPAMSAPTLRAEPAFNSFFGKPESEPVQTEIARKLLMQWRGPGALVVVTHQVNITAITGEIPQSGEGIVILRNGDRLIVQGRIPP